MPFGLPEAAVLMHVRRQCLIYDEAPPKVEEFRRIYRRPHGDQHDPDGVDGDHGQRRARSVSA